MPPSFPGLGTLKFAEILMDPVLRGEMAEMTGDPNWLARAVNESEPNDTLEQANGLGTSSATELWEMDYYAVAVIVRRPWVALGVSESKSP